MLSNPLDSASPLSQVGNLIESCWSVRGKKELAKLPSQQELQLDRNHHDLRQRAEELSQQVLKKRAELEASAKAAKAQTIVDAEAEAEKMRIRAQGEASAIFAKLEAEAKGQYEILAKKGQGLREIVSNCGGADAAFRMLMLEHIDHLSEVAAQAISNIKFDKVVVWDGQGSGGDGGSATSNFLRGLASSLPPALTMMKDIGGVEMPEFFGRLIEEAEKVEAEEVAEPTPEDEPATEE